METKIREILSDLDSVRENLLALFRIPSVEMVVYLRQDRDAKG